MTNTTRNYATSHTIAYIKTKDPSIKLSLTFEVSFEMEKCFFIFIFYFV